MADELNLEYLNLEPLIAQVVEIMKNFDHQKARIENLIDPFAAAFEVALLERQDFETWSYHEFERQRQKALLNAVGDLHQSILGLLSGLTSYPASRKNPMPDIVCMRGSQKIIAEIKNKHNTMNDRSAKGTFARMEKDLDQKNFLDYVGVVVPIIAPVPKSGEKMWHLFAPGADNIGRDDILIMSGRVFYTIVTDTECRQPLVDFDQDEDLTLWPSWKAIDLVTTKFLSELQRQTGVATPNWITDLFPQAIGQ